MQEHGGRVPGDRCIVDTPCSSNGACTSLLSSAPSSDHQKQQQRYLDVEPYSFVFKAPAKGRWLDMPLLAVCVKEFAYVPPPPQPRGDVGGKLTDGGEAASGVVLDHRRTMTAYIDELCDGSLWLQNREAECRLAGQTYRDALVQHLCRTEQSSASSSPSPLSSSSWSDVKQRICTLLPADTDVIQFIQSALPPLLCLRQRDVVLHRVWRREGRIFADDPIQIYRCDLQQMTADEKRNPLAQGGDATNHGTPPIMMVYKPSGLPVHPSGCYRKNSVTSILEDVFGGCDADKYTYKEPCAPSVTTEGDAKGKEREEEEGGLRYASIIHRQYGFELIRVWISDSEHSSRGVSTADWALLKEKLHRPEPSTVSADANHSNSCNTAASASVGLKHARSEEEPAAPSHAHPPPSPLKLFVVHRLDAATSGVLIFGLNAEAARQTATLIAQKGGEPTSGTEEEASAVSGSSRCSKTYLACVRGRVDVVAAAASQHHCSLLLADGKEEEKEGEEHWLCVARPIGCLSFQNSTYWCPGDTQTQQWMDKQQAQAQQLIISSTGPSSTPSALGAAAAASHSSKNNKKDARLLAEKHARMKEMTRGGRRQLPLAAVTAPSDASSPTTVTSNTERNDDFTHSLRSAVTHLRVVHYDAQTDRTIVACRLLTGRTHQLRVHLASIGHPIHDDGKYVSLQTQLQLQVADGNCSAREMMQGGSGGGEDDGDGGSRSSCICPERISLHAWQYGLTYGSGETVVLQADPPAWAVQGRHMK